MLDFIELPEEPYDSRSLFDRLKEQKDKKELEFEEAHKLSKYNWGGIMCTNIIDSMNLIMKDHIHSDVNWIEFFSIENLIRGLDDDEINFLDIVDKAKLDAEKQKQIQDQNEMLEFRQRVATLQEQSIEQVRTQNGYWWTIILRRFLLFISDFHSAEN